MSEHQAQPDFVKKKIRENSKTHGPIAHARKEQWPKSLAKVIKKAISISELLTEEDQEENLRVIREAKQATHKIFDPVTKTLIDVPDTKSRLAGVALDLAYREGRPVERQIKVNTNFDDFSELLKKFRSSPEAMRSWNEKETMELPAIDVESDPQPPLASPQTEESTA